jgi:glycosyltransferase involved in cell wall biosynthesis
MRVLVFHGYLLRGTGSNIYTAGLAAALVGLGHEVDLVCQERHASELSFVGAVGDWDAGELRVRRVRASACTVYRPQIGGLLPVYVLDRYEGLEARLFSEVTDAELDAYVGANVDAVTDVLARARPDVALANHLVMGPTIVARALSRTRVPYAVAVHGSALEYTVKPHPRFLPYAREGVRAANAVLVGSSHTANSLWAALQEPGLRAKTRLGPPGVDIGTFRPLERAQAAAQVRALAGRLAQRSLDPASREPGERSDPRAPESGFRRDRAATADALGRLAEAASAERLVTFVGKLIVSKGIDLLLLAWPLILASVPTGRLAVVGFGAYRSAAERMTVALSRGDLDEVYALAASGRGAEGGPRSRLSFATSFVEGLEAAGQRQRYLEYAKVMHERVVFTGRLEHAELASFLRLCEAMVVPSTFPEAFGMVAVEAAACGVLPITAAHSGLAEVSRTLARAVAEPYREFLSFPLDDHVVESIAARVISWLRTPADIRAATRSALVETVAARYSWDAVAHGVIAAARGELDALDAPA